MSATEPAVPANNLAHLILALLAPMFLWSTEGDIRLAYRAAAETVNEYRIANRLSLYTVAKIIAFDIATLSSLSQSMYEDVSVLLALRLRGNATSLDRSGERNRRALEQQERTGADQSADTVEAAVAQVQRMVREARPRVRAATPAAETMPNAEPAPVAETEEVNAPMPEVPAKPAARTAEWQRRSARAGAMTAVAGQFAAGLEDLPPEEQWKQMTLTTAASDLTPECGPAAGCDSR
jgi:hypothetical protein